MLEIMHRDFVMSIFRWMGREMDAQAEFWDNNIQVENTEHWANELLTAASQAFTHEL